MSKDSRPRPPNVDEDSTQAGTPPGPSRGSAGSNVKVRNVLREPVDDDNDGRRAQEAERDEEAVPAGARMVDAVVWARALARRHRGCAPAPGVGLRPSSLRCSCQFPPARFLLVPSQLSPW